MRAALVLVALLLTTIAGAAGAVAQPLGCTDRADVSWDADWDTVLVDGVRVHVPGCADGEIVGLQLLGDDGDLLPEPLFAPVDGERAFFDVSGAAIGIEPVTGVRVSLHGDGGGVIGDDLDPDDRDPPDGTDGDGDVADGDGTDDGASDGGSTDGGASDGGAPGAGGGGDGTGDGGTSPTRSPLPRTGVEVLVVLAVGLAMLVLGGSFLAARRQSRNPWEQR